MNHPAPHRGHFCSSAVLAALGACLLASPTLSQGFTMPAGYETTGNDPGAGLPGNFRPNGHVQLLYGSYQGSNKVALVKRLSFRRESATGVANKARTWSNVTLNVGDCDFTQLSDVFADNLVKPVNVFSGSVSWPATSGKPTSNPPPWGKFAGTSFDVSFPFSTQFMHLGQLGFAADLQFSGGTVLYADYIVAGVADTHTLNLNPQTYYGGRKCKATGRTTPANFVLWMYSNNVPGGKKLFRYSFYGDSYPSNAPVVGAITLFGSSTAVPVPGACQGLFLNASKPMYILGYQASSEGLLPWTYHNLKYDTNLLNTTVWAQAAFTDLGVTQLSNAAATVIAPTPIFKPEYGARLVATQLGGYQPGGWGDLYDTNVPIIYLHQ